MASDDRRGCARFLIALLINGDSFRLLKYLHNSKFDKSLQ